MWGRCVFDNVRRFLQFQLTVNVAAVFIAFIGSILGEGESPLKPIQLLWVNMIMDSLGALALATEKPRPYLLERPPYGKRVPLLSPVLILNIGGQGLYQIIISVLMMTVGEKIWTDMEGDSDRLNTMIFNTFVFCQIFNLPNSRVVAKSQSLIDGLFSNTLFLIIFFGIAVVQAIICEFGGIVFHTTGLTWAHWLSTLLMGVLCWVLGFILRAVPVKELSYEDVERQRVDAYEAVKETLRGLSAEEQWALENRQAEEATAENAKKGKKPANEAQTTPTPAAKQAPPPGPEAKPPAGTPQGEAEEPPPEDAPGGGGADAGEGGNPPDAPDEESES
jgi:Ca2+-transporting ATPase